MYAYRKRGDKEHRVRILPIWEIYSQSNKSLPHEFFYKILLSGDLAVDGSEDELDNSSKNNLPLFVPGWEDSTIGTFSHLMLLILS